MKVKERSDIELAGDDGRGGSIEILLGRSQVGK